MRFPIAPVFLKFWQHYAELIALSLSACASTPEPVVEEPVAVIVPEVVSTCTPISALKRVVIPA